MRTIAIVPAKAPALAKTRLAAELAEGDRAAVSLDMLRGVLAQIGRVPAIAGCAVVSADESVLALARQLGCEPIRETGESGLNPALDLGRVWALDSGADALLVIPADLPLVRASDLADIVSRGEAQGPGIVIAPSKDGGTNALLLRPPSGVPFCFGPDSARRHQLEAELRGLAVSVLQRDTLAFDVDTPADLTAYLAIQEGLAQLDEAQALAAR
jgi:2-phospho-L-lactate/phosphoenolpyruvate guanylyltransferase